MENRIKWIDLSRVIAILAVIFCHCFDNTYYYIIDLTVNALSFSSKFFVFSGYIFGRLGVPFFLLITGYLLLDRKYDNEKTNRFWSKNCKHLIICTIIWCIIYELFLIFVMHNDYTLITVLGDILLLRPMNINHIWYMPMIIGMYVLIPLVANGLKEFDTDTLVKPLLFFLVLCSVIPFLLKILQIYDITGLSVQVSLGFSGGMYGIYIITGYLIKKGLLKRFSSMKLFIILIISIVVTVIFQIFSFNQDYAYYLWYDFPFMYLISICLFELISRINDIKAYDIIYFLSKFAFAVYLIHNLFKLLISEMMKEININASIRVFILWISVILLSYLATFIISKIPRIGKYVLYIK